MIKKEDEFECNVATLFDVVIKDIIYQSSQSKNQPIEFTNKINQPTQIQKKTKQKKNI